MARGLQVVSAIAAALFSVEGARIKRANRREVGAKFIGGVPVLNYHLAYGAQTSLVERKGAQRWLVVLDNDVSDEQVDALCHLSKCIREGHPSKHGVPYFEVEATETELEEVITAGGGSMMKFIEPDVEMSLSPEIQVDDVQSSPWGLKRVGVPGAAGKGEGVNIYVVDTGVRTTHTDYGGRATSYLDMTSDSLVECKGNLNCAEDRNGHGSHCAGSAAGTTYGVAPGASIYSIKVLPDSGRGGAWSWSVDALDYMCTQAKRPAVASMSLGGQAIVATLETAVDRAVAAGIVVVVASGNSNMNACEFTPAFVSSAITVSSTDSADKKSGFSNFGECVDIWAPGSAIKSAWWRSDDDSVTIDGTSMACPHVSGGAALILEANPSFDPAAVWNSMEASGEKGAISGLKTGDTNLLLWVSAAAAPVPAPTPAPPPFTCPSWCSGFWCFADACNECPNC